MISYISEMSDYEQIFYTLEYMIESGDMIIDDAIIINEKAFEKFARAKEELKDIGYGLRDCASDVKDYLNGKSRERNIGAIARSLGDGTETSKRIGKVERYTAFENFIRETAFKHGCKRSASPKEIIKFYNQLIIDGKITPGEKQRYISSQLAGPQSAFGKERELKDLGSTIRRKEPEQPKKDKVVSKIKVKVGKQPIRQIT